MTLIYSLSNLFIYLLFIYLSLCKYICFIDTTYLPLVSSVSAKSSFRTLPYSIQSISMLFIPLSIYPSIYLSSCIFALLTLPAPSIFSVCQIFLKDSDFFYLSLCKYICFIFTTYPQYLLISAIIFLDDSNIQSIYFIYPSIHLSILNTSIFMQIYFFH